MNDADNRLARKIATAATPLHGHSDDYDKLLDAVGDATLVLLGGASQGTHQFYRERAQITKRLIEEKGFVAVATDADWHDAYRVNRYLRGRSDDLDSVDALDDFRHFPQWPWRNADVLDFVGWLRSHNDAALTRTVGFYGLDLYSLYGSAQVVTYLDRIDPEVAARVRQRYACFEDVGEDPQLDAPVALSRSRQDELVAQLVAFHRRRGEQLARDGLITEDQPFAAEQLARAARSAEGFYRALFGKRSDAWNLRETHLTDTLDALMAHLGRDRAAKIVVWSPNTHVGDARATQPHASGRRSLGQLLRERHPDRTFTVGATTSRGTLSSAEGWDQPVVRTMLQPARPGSYEALFSQVGLARFFLDPRRFHGLRDELLDARLERAIGVVYKPGTRRPSHYFEARLPEQFDVVLHFNETRAVEPLERTIVSYGDERQEAQAPAP
jgi:erythromycin esterase-like protein